MSEKSLSVGVTIEPLVGGIVGGAIGYSCARRKYSVRDLITLNKDTFERIYPDDVVKEFSEDERAALSSMKQARAEYETVKCSTRNVVNQKTSTWKALYDGIAVPEDIRTEYQQRKTVLDNLMRDYNYADAVAEYRRLQCEVRKSPSNQQLREQFINADRRFSTITVKLYEAINSYRPAVRKLALAKKKQIKENPEKFANIREAAQNIQAACAERSTILSNKLFELCTQSSVKNSYEILKSTIPKSRIRASIIGAIITGFITSLLAHIMYKSAGKTIE